MVLEMKRLFQPVFLGLFLIVLCIITILPASAERYETPISIQEALYDAPSQTLSLVSRSGDMFTKVHHMARLPYPDRVVIEIPNAFLSTPTHQIPVHTNGIDRIELVQSSGMTYQLVQVTVYLSHSDALDSINIRPERNRLIVGLGNPSDLNKPTPYTSPQPRQNQPYSFLDTPVAPPVQPVDNRNILQPVTYDNGSFYFTLRDNRPLTIKRQFTLSNPNRLVIDIQNTVLMDVRMTDPLIVQSKDIYSIRLGQFDENTVRVVVEALNPKRLSLGYTGSDKSQIALSPGANAAVQTIPLEPNTTELGENGFDLNSLPLKKGPLSVVIDPGHGGKDPGAARNGVLEKHLNLTVAKKLKQLLEAKGITVYMTRTTDVFLSLSQITAFTNRIHPDAFISIHTNASVSPSLNGIETYYNTPQSRDLAKQVHGRLISNVGSRDGNVRNARFYVIRNTRIPAILVETGYLSNSTERQALQDQWRQNVTAESIAQGVMQFLGRRLTVQAPKPKTKAG
jgi:N-acetylmuramoyl-L-alanine amidase